MLTSTTAALCVARGAKKRKKTSGGSAGATASASSGGAGKGKAKSRQAGASSSTYNGINYYDTSAADIGDVSTMAWEGVGSAGYY